jgi:hypothetical protein
VPVVAEATQRGKAAVAAAKGELELPKEKKKGRWLMRIAIVAAVAGAAVFVIRRVLGGRDADWQAARPTTPYAPPRPAGAPGTGQSTAAPVVDGAMAEAGDDDQGGLSAHLLNLEADGAAVPDQPAEGGDVEAPAEAAAAVEEALDAAAEVREETPIETAPDSEMAESAPPDVATAESAPPDDAAAAPTAVAAPEAETRSYQGEGVYVGHEPPEGFTIKGNERSMKYHVPESAGYGRTVAEVWFNSEEAAKQAGFVRAQR